MRDIDFSHVWRSRPARDRLRVPIGQTTDGAPIIVDLKEAAQQGMGPHGVMIGATGSGKSEVLRTLVLALALTHSPEQAELCPRGLQGWSNVRRHVRHAARQRGDHEPRSRTRARRPLPGRPAGRGDPPPGTPATGRQLRQRPRVREGAPGRPCRTRTVARAHDRGRRVLRTAGRQARVHREPSSTSAAWAVPSRCTYSSPHSDLRKASLRGLDTFLSYRIGLRTFSAAESRTILGVPDAYTLPQQPGVGILKSDTETMTQFRAAYVSGPPQRRAKAREGVSGAGRADAVVEPVHRRRSGGAADRRLPRPARGHRASRRRRTTSVPRSIWRST
ncbi:FtsK/SpoIIIE domain-containing protein [Demequina litorisediminis]|uniref:FtsK/SpoIIIE domain-containing protein n=1 Tax=Demequina litorisediminis TaxID=1849022 RepID=UPI003D667FD1